MANTGMKEQATSDWHRTHLISSSQVRLEVKDVMRRDVATVCSDETVLSAAKIMSESNISCIIAVDNGNVTGILTETDLLKTIAGRENGFDKMLVSRIMSSPVETISADLSILEAGKIMEDKCIKRLPILEEKRLVGIVTQTDLTRALTSYGVWSDIAGIMTPDVVGIHSSATVTEAAEVMASHRISSIVILREDAVVGILTERDLFKRVLAPQQDPDRVKVEQVMSSPVQIVPPTYSIFSVGGVMKKMHIRRVLCMEEKRLCGIVTQTDIFRALKKRLQTEEEENLLLLEESANGVYTLDSDGKIIYVNPALMKLLDVTEPEELISQPFLPQRFWFSSRHRKRFLKELRKATVEISELTLKTFNGRRIYVTLFSSLTRDIHGRPNGSQGVLYDITARKELVKLRKTQEALRQMHEKLMRKQKNIEAIFDAAPVGMLLVDEDMIIKRANDGIRQMVHRDYRQIVNYRMDDVLGNWEPEQNADGCVYSLQEVVERTLNSGRAVHGLEIHPVMKVAGKEINPWLHISVEPTMIDGRKHTVIAIDDITERKRAEEEKKVMLAQLRQQEKLKSIGTFASGVAHEINNPLTAVINYAQLINDRTQDDSVKQFSEAIIDQSCRMAKIVRNLLFFACRQKDKPKPAHVKDIIDDSLSLIGAVLCEDRITVEKDIPDDLPQVVCRIQQIEQVIINLLTNARDAINCRYQGYHENKIIRISARVFNHENTEWLRITVEDHGIGIPPDIIDRIFEPFFTSKPVNDGTGLGLSVSYGIVKEHHGQFLVESQPESFTRFHVELRVDNEWFLQDCHADSELEAEAAQQITIDN